MREKTSLPAKRENTFIRPPLPNEGRTFQKERADRRAMQGEKIWQGARGGGGGSSIYLLGRDQMQAQRHTIKLNLEKVGGSYALII